MNKYFITREASYKAMATLVTKQAMLSCLSFLASDVAHAHLAVLPVLCQNRLFSPLLRLLTAPGVCCLLNLGITGDWNPWDIAWESIGWYKPKLCQGGCWEFEWYPVLEQMIFSSVTCCYTHRSHGKHTDLLCSNQKSNIWRLSRKLLLLGIQSSHWRANICKTSNILKCLSQVSFSLAIL